MDRKLLQKNHPPLPQKKNFRKVGGGEPQHKQIVNMRTEFSLTRVSTQKRRHSVQIQSLQLHKTTGKKRTHCNSITHKGRGLKILKGQPFQIYFTNIFISVFLCHFFPSSAQDEEVIDFCYDSASEGRFSSFTIFSWISVCLSIYHLPYCPSVLTLSGWFLHVFLTICLVFLNYQYKHLYFYLS